MPGSLKLNKNLKLNLKFHNSSYFNKILQGVLICKMLKYKHILFIIAMSSISFSSHSKEAHGLSFQAAIGVPSVEIENPNGSAAGFDGLSVLGKVLVPIFENNFSMYVSGQFQYDDLKNSINSNQFAEMAHHYGPGLGLKFTYYSLYLSYNYYLMRASHSYVGSIGNQIEYGYNTSQISTGLDYNVGKMLVGIGYTFGSGQISKSEIRASRNAKISNKTVWLNFTFVTGASVASLTRELVVNK